MTIGISTVLCVMHNRAGQPRGAREGVAPRDRVIASCQHILAQPVKFYTYPVILVGINKIIMSGFSGFCLGQILGFLDGVLWQLCLPSLHNSLTFNPLSLISVH